MVADFTGLKTTSDGRALLLRQTPSKLNLLPLLAAWYNGVDRHSEIGIIKPKMVHYGKAEKVCDLRQSVLDQPYSARPERFVHSAPESLELLA